MTSTTAGEYKLADGVHIGGAIDWEGGVMEAENPPSPCRTIPVTPQMRELDAAQRRARELRPIAWSRPSTAKPARDPDAVMANVRLQANRNEKPRNMQDAMRFLTCEWCPARLPTGEMKAHRPVCPNRPKPARRRKTKFSVVEIPVNETSPAQPSPAQPEAPAAAEVMSTPKKRLASVASRTTRTWFEESELDAIWAALPVCDKWTLLKPALREV